MPVKEWIAVHEGLTIRVVNTWFRGAWLYVDGQCLDRCHDLFAIDGLKPSLSASIPTSHGRPLVVQVFLKAILTTKARICVDGRQVGGDVFGRWEDAKPPGKGPTHDDEL